MPTGKLKFFDAHKGFGFVVPDDGANDIYISARAVEESKLPLLKAGDRLEFDLRVTGQRRTAVNLRTAPSPEEALESFEREWGLKPA